MLRIENLSVAIGEREVLRDVNLHIKPGEVHALFGPNGTGKSTLIGAIMGFERFRITGGRIFFQGEDVTGLPVHERAKRGLGVMIQRPPTIRGLSVRQMIDICGGPGTKTEELAGLVNMADFLGRAVNEGFSGGEIKRSELLQLMAQRPDLVLLDEPESGVDMENIAVVGRAINFILQRGQDGKHAASLHARRASRHQAGLIITHTGYIMEYVPVDIAHILYKGTITCHGNPQEMLRCIRDEGYEHCVSCARQA